MKHSYFSGKKLAGMLTALSALAIAQTPVQAAEVADLGALELGKKYEIGEEYIGKRVDGHYTASKDINLRVTHNGNWSMDFYKDVFDNNPANFPVNYSGTNFHVLSLKEGETVYLTSGKLTVSNYFTWDFILNDNDLLEKGIEYVAPSEESPYSPSMNAYVDVTFTDKVQVEKATIAVGSKSADVYCTILNYDLTARIPVKETLTAWYASGDAKAGDTMTVTLKGIKCNDQPLEDYTVTYTLQEAPANLVKVTNAGTLTYEFLSYYLPGDERGIVTLEFDRDLMPLTQTRSLKVMLQMGDVEGTNMFVEKLFDAEDRTYTEEDLKDCKVSVDGGKMTIDFTGVLRDYATILPNITAEMQKDPTFNVMSLNIYGVKDANGQFTTTPYDWSIGSYGYTYNFKELNANITIAFYPKKGTVVGEGKAMEIYVRGLENIRFDGVKISYPAGDETKEMVVKGNSVSIVEDPDDAEANLVKFTFPRLEGCAEGAEVTVSLNDLYSVDGYDHSSDAMVKYVYTQEKTESGINEVTVGQCCADVYGIDGRVVARGYKADDLKSLPKGLYIIGGKKVVIK